MSKISLESVRRAFCASLLVACVSPAIAQKQVGAANSGSVSSAISKGTGSVTPNLRYCPPDDPDPCDPIPTNKAPIVNWAAVPVNGSWFLPTDTFAVDAYASDPDGSVAKVVFYLDNQIVATDTVAPYHAVVSGLTAGVHTLGLVAWDNQGRTAQAGNVTINVRNSVIAGNIDGVSSSGLITGWACSTWLPQSINVDLYVGGPYGTGTGVGRFLANKTSEAAVASACSVGSGSYRFQIQLSDAQRVLYGGQTIYIHGISPIGAANSLIGASGNFRVPLAVRNAQFSTQTLVTAMLPGQTKSVTVQMRNNGNYTWTTATSFRLGSQNPANNSTWGVSRVNATSDVAPGQTGTFNFTIKAPATPGVYNLQWQMLQESVAWFGDLTPNQVIKVLSGSISASPVTCTIPTGGSTCTVTLNWSSNSSTSQVWVSGLDGSSPKLFAANQSGSQAASWITTQGARFTLKSDGYDLDSVDVRGIPAPVVSSVATIEYDELGQVIVHRDSAGHIVASYTYDAGGRVHTVTDGVGRTTSLDYDALGRVSASTDAAGVTHYLYDVADRMTKVIDPRGNATTYTLDGFGQLWKQVSPDTGTTSFTYNAGGQRTGLVRNDGSALSYTYDSLGRLTAVTGGQESRTYSYDTCTNGKGLLCRISGITGGVTHSWSTFAYSPEGWLTSRQDAVQGAVDTTGYSYDSMGRPTGISYPSGVAVGYAYDHGKPAAVTSTVGGVTTVIANGFHYQPFGAASEWTYGNGLKRSTAFDMEGRLASLTAGNASTVLQSLTYTHDLSDHITGISNGVDAAQSHTYSYDAVGRLWKDTSKSQTWTFDANGNRSQYTASGVQADFVIEPSSNRVTSYTTLAGQRTDYQYDARGNRSVAHDQPGVMQSYGYNAFNRLTTVTTDAQTTSLVYNAQDQRVAKDGPNGQVRFTYVGNQLATEHGPAGWKSYIWLGEELAGVVQSNGTTSFVLNDHLGRPELATNASRQVVWQAKNAAYDRAVILDQIGGLNLGFPGQYQDIETGLWINGFRTYDDSIGRYLESDPMGLAGGVNSYAYAQANPISLVDPSGLESAQYSIGQIPGQNYMTDCEANATLKMEANLVPLTAMLQFGKDVSGLDINFQNGYPDFTFGSYSWSGTGGAALGYATDQVAEGVYGGRIANLERRAAQAGLRYQLRNAASNRLGRALLRKAALEGVGKVLGPLGAFYDYFGDLKKCGCEDEKKGS